MIEVAETLRALGDETRLRMVRLLMQKSLNVGELTRILGLAQPTVSKHLAELRKAGLVEGNRSSGYSYYRAGGELHKWGKAFSDTLSHGADEKGDLVRLQEVLRQRQDRAEVPDRFVVPGRSWAAWSRSLRHLLPSLRVADFGCGDGTFTAEIASWAKQVYAIDCNSAFLKLARQKTNGTRNVRFLQEDMQRVSLGAGSMDVVVISQSLHYLEKPQRPLQEAFRILVKGGRLLVLDLLPHQETWVISELHHRWLGFPITTVRRWVKEAGFRKIQTETQSRQGPDPFQVFLATGMKP